MYPLAPYSEKISSKVLCERSPEKFDDRTKATKRREGKLAANSHETVAEKFILRLYTNEKSPAYHGFSYEQSVALRKAFSVLKVNGKYSWEVYICSDKYPDTWPSVKFLTLPSFSALPIPDCDKQIARGKFPPEDGIWPIRQIDPKNIMKGTAGPSTLAETLPSLGKSMEASSLIMSNGFLVAAALRAPNNKTQDTKIRVIFTRVAKGVDDETSTKYESMSGTYVDEGTPMGDIFDTMWKTDTSPVFFLTTEQEDGMREKTHEYRMFVSSEMCAAEKLYTQQTFAVEKVGNMTNLVGSSLVEVRIECTKKEESNLVRRQLFSWR